jgi:D-alanyl-D-alanine carboxypeptidase (penicillin-binding protein 5/6)
VRRGRLSSRAAAAIAASLALLCLLLSAPAPAAAQEPQLAARAWVLVDPEDGEVLAARRAHGSYPVASTTKLMTALVARDRLGLGETVVAPAYNAIAAESLLGLVAGERIEVRDLLYGLLLASGNDAAVALAQASAGSEPRFVRQMNRTARRLGLDDTSYANPIGLDDPKNFSSAKDLVDLTIELREDRLFRKIFDTPQATLQSGARTRTVTNRNTLVLNVPEVTGVKTGHTLGAGYVLVGSAERGDVELVSAVLGASSESARDAETMALLDYGFSLYRPQKVFERAERVAGAAVRDQGTELPLQTTRALKLTVRADEDVETELDVPAEVEGPIERGERLGEALVSVDGELVDRVPIAAARSIPQATLLQRFDGSVPGPRAVAWLVAIGGLALLGALAIFAFDRRRR